MKAAVLTTYGSPENLKISEIETPKVCDSHILVRVRAASINDWDWAIVQVSHFIYVYYVA